MDCADHRLRSDYHPHRPRRHVLHGTPLNEEISPIAERDFFFIRRLSESVGLDNGLGQTGSVAVVAIEHFVVSYIVA